MGCGVGGGFRFGARTAWHRFEAGGAGSLRLSASSSYDVMLFAFKTTLPRGAKGFGQNVLTSLECQDERTALGDELFTAPMRVAAGDVVAARHRQRVWGRAVQRPDRRRRDDAHRRVRRRRPRRRRRGRRRRRVPGRAGRGRLSRRRPGSGPGPGRRRRARSAATVVRRSRAPPDDGCLDGDRDAISDAVDACPTVAGNGRDGCPQPLKATFSNLWTNYARGSRVERLQVKAPRGAIGPVAVQGEGVQTPQRDLPAEALGREPAQVRRPQPHARARHGDRGARDGAADARHLHPVRDPRQAPEPAPHGPLHHRRGQLTRC